MTDHAQDPRPAGPVLVTGATGNVGRAVVEARWVPGAPVRAALRPSSPSDTPPVWPVEVDRAVFDWQDPRTWDGAFAGASSVLVVRPPQLSRPTTQMVPALRAARQAGAEAGHSPETLKVGLHMFGYVGEDVRSASDIVYPGWHQMFTDVSRERGFRPPSRLQFDRTSGPDGAFVMGDPDTVVTKLARVSEQLGGVHRVSIQMTNPRMPIPTCCAASSCWAPTSHRGWPMSGV